MNNVYFSTTEPVFVPRGAIKGTTVDSMTVGWTEPEGDAAEFITTYKLSLVDLSTGDLKQSVEEAPAYDHLFTGLTEATQYNFTVNRFSVM